MELFERVRVICKEVAGSQTALATQLHLSQSRFQGYLSRKRQENLWVYLQDILQAYPQVSRDWLYFDEGPMLPEEKISSPAKNTPATLQPIPVVGLAACGVEGWNQMMPITVSATLPLAKNMMAVIAAGECMVPAGIGPGQICYCDPDQQPLAGDAVYVVRKGGLAAIKLYVGEGELGSDWIRMKGWLPAKEGDQMSFFLDIAISHIEKIAPVIFVRRRI